MLYHFVTPGDGGAPVRRRRDHDPTTDISNLTIA